MSVLEEIIRLFADNIISGVMISVFIAVIAASSIGGLAGIILNTIPTVMNLKSISVIAGVVLYIATRR